MSYTIRLDNGTRWKVREAVSLEAACNSIAHACVTGSIGDKVTLTEMDSSFRVKSVKVLAHVVRINSDGTECRAYEPAY